MAGESLVAVTQGSGKNLHTWNRTIGANGIEDEFTLPGEYPLATYWVSPAAQVSGATGGDDLFQIMAGASLNVRIRRIRVEAVGITTAAIMQLQLARVTSAGTGGTAITPAKADNGDVAAGATAASGVPNATHGTIGTQFFLRNLWPIQTVGTGGSATFGFEWTQTPNAKPIIIPAGATNGLVMRNTLGRAGSNFTFEVEFVESSFL